MKKLLTSILSLALAAAMSVPALAANSAKNDGTTGSAITVNGKYQEGAPSPDVISVDLTWDDMTFEYTEGKKTWNPTTHKYDQEAGTWGQTPKYIYITNHSNIDIKIKTTAKPVGDIKFNFTENNMSLASADGRTTPDSTHEGVMIEGGSITENGRVGTVTVGIYKPDAVTSDFDLADALEEGGDIVIACDMILGSSHEAKSSETTNLNLNGKKLTFIPMLESEEMNLAVWSEGTVLNIKNGELCGTTKNIYPLYTGGNAVVNAEKCTFSTVSGGTAVKMMNLGKINLKDCTINGNIEFYKDDPSSEGTNTLTLSGSIILNGEFIGLPDCGKIICLAGTYNFDVSSYVDTTLYDVTNDGTTWTVTAK